MKKIIIIYWLFTGLFTLLAVMGSVLDIIHSKDAVDLITHLGYPMYFITFIGVVRLLGVIAILIPGYPKIKEWAYAGLVFDMGGALYSHIATGDPFGIFAPAVIALILVVGSYIYYHKGYKHVFNPIK
ncbi:MAG TPA: DoxX family protein [Chitinophagaceae bacterium]|nr:DoxX family protein [Chitinophagaceae bacterium]